MEIRAEEIALVGHALVPDASNYSLCGQREISLFHLCKLISRLGRQDSSGHFIIKYPTHPRTWIFDMSNLDCHGPSENICPQLRFDHPLSPLIEAYIATKLRLDVFRWDRPKLGLLNTPA